MKRICSFLVVALLAGAAFASDGARPLELKAAYQLPPPPTTYSIEAVWDQETKAPALGVSAFWKRFTKGDKVVDVYFFAGVDRRNVPVGALAGKFPLRLADQLTFYVSPAVEWKQGGKGYLTLFAGVTLR